MEASDVFDTESIICEIKKKHPCLWNYKSESYNNRIEKNNTWALIYEKFSANFNEKSTKEKHQVGKYFIVKFQIACMIDITARRSSGGILLLNCVSLR
jgi:hypothetical protein